MGVPGSANFLLAGAQGYQIERSLRFNSADSAYLELTTGGTAGNQTTWTFSCWVKRSKLATVQHIFNPSVGGDSANESLFRFETSDKIRIYDSGTTRGDFVTTQVFRDTSAWYHIVVALDTTQGTSTNRFKLYVNGVQITTFDTASYPGPSVTWGWNRASTRHRIGAYAFPSTASNFGDFYLTEIHHVDGQALTPSSFGETDTITGVWKPKKYAGTYGTNGFYLKFADNSGTTSTTLGKDSSGNGNNWTPNNFSVTAGAGNDSLIDTPTPYADGGNGRGNYCTLNPLDSVNSTFANGNLDVTVGAGAGSLAFGNFQMKAGKWYWEVVPTSINNPMIGIADADKAISTRTWGQPNGWYYYVNGQKYNNSAGTAYGASFTTNDVIGVAYDADNGSIVFYKNGTSQGTAFTGLTGKGIVPALNNGASATSEPFTCNFGQRSFSYTPPAGFSALNTQNLPEPSIKKPSSYFDTLLWAGNNANPRTLGGLNFSPDLVWVKDRTQATNHRLVDAVRGGNKTLKSNLTDAETSSESAGTVSAFTSDGFTLAGTSTMDGVNLTGDSYVAWCWDESATPGFDIVTFTGTGAVQNISHSLGVAPSMMIGKSRNITGSWAVYHASIGANNILSLNSTNASTAASTVWNNTAPTSSQFTVGSFFGAGETDVAYLWSEVAGFSKFGSYTGNGSSDGPFLYCGFQPKFLLIKSSSSGYDWFIFDDARNTYNAVDLALFPNASGAESGGSTYLIDFTSNGFKLRNTQLNLNGSGNTYIFAAWAEFPAKYSLAR